MIYKVDDEVITPKGRGTIIRIDGNEYLINLHAKPGVGPFRYPATRIRRIPVEE